jgi:hypothetical protein
MFGTGRKVSAFRFRAPTPNGGSPPVDEIIAILEAEADIRRRRLSEVEDQIGNFLTSVTRLEEQKASDEAYLATVAAAIDAIRARLA